MKGLFFQRMIFSVVVEGEDNMDTNKMIEIIRKEYVEVVIDWRSIR